MFQRLKTISNLLGLLGLLGPPAYQPTQPTQPIRPTSIGDTFGFGLRIKNPSKILTKFGLVFETPRNQQPTSKFIFKIF
jgi:hypothetical protein